VWALRIVAEQVGIEHRLRLLGGFELGLAALDADVLIQQRAV